MALESPVNRKLPILKKSRCTTGIPNLDILLEGGYAGDGLNLLVGPTGMEKNTFAFHFIQEGIKNNETIIYIVSDMDHEELIKKASSVGFDFKKPMLEGKLIFIDCYSSSNNSLEKSEAMDQVISVPGPSSLNDLSLAVKGVLQDHTKGKLRVVFHSLSTFILYNPLNSIIKFLQLVGGRLKRANASTLFLVEEGMHEKTILSSIEHMMDEIYYLYNKDGFILESSKLPIPVPLNLSSTGIELK